MKTNNAIDFMLLGAVQLKDGIKNNDKAKTEKGFKLFASAVKSPDWKDALKILAEVQNAIEDEEEMDFSMDDEDIDDFEEEDEDEDVEASMDEEDEEEVDFSMDDEDIDDFEEEDEDEDVEASMDEDEEEEEEDAPDFSMDDEDEENDEEEDDEEDIPVEAASRIESIARQMESKGGQKNKMIASQIRRLAKSNLR